MKEVWALWLADQIREKASVWLSLKDAEKLRRGVRRLEIENRRTVESNADRQATAILRIEEVCQRNGLEFFRPVNDRECALYISKADMGMNETNYSRFIPCYAS
jgi:hypothetical protein